MPVTDEVDMVEFGRLIGVQTDPGKDPITWLDEMRAKVAGLQSHLGGLGAAGPEAVTNALRQSSGHGGGDDDTLVDDDDEPLDLPRMEY